MRVNFTVSFEGSVDLDIEDDEDPESQIKAQLIDIVRSSSGIYPYADCIDIVVEDLN